MGQFEPRRWVIFTRSVISTVGNPDAHLFRALAAALARRGLDAVCVEERANPAVVALLQQQGARGVDAFRADHPALHYRTVPPRSGLELVEWLGGALATADVALVQHDAPADLVLAVGSLTRPHLQTYLIDSGLGAPLAPGELAARRPAAYSAVLIGRVDDADAYRERVPPARLHHFGPLPSSDADEPPPSLREAAEGLVEVIARLARRGDRSVPADR